MALTRQFDGMKYETIPFRVSEGLKAMRNKKPSIIKLYVAYIIEVILT